MAEQSLRKGEVGGSTPLIGSREMTMKEEVKNSLEQTGRYWIAFTGDSITSTEWVHPNWRDVVIYVLQNAMEELFAGEWKIPSWGIRGFNFGYDGATTTDVLIRMDDILAVKPDLMIGLMGGNDPVLGVSVEQSIDNIEEIVKRAENQGTKVVWCSSTPAGGEKKNLEYQPYAEAFLQMPDRDNLMKVDMFNLYRQYPMERFFTFKSEENPVEGVKAGEVDLQHPNQLGNAYIAKIILKEVFGIKFDGEKYISDTLAGEKFPEY